MRKHTRLLILISVIALAAVALLTFTACDGAAPNTVSKYSLKIVGDTDEFSYYVGEINYSDISFEVYDEQSKLVETVTALESMLSPEDKARLQSSGTKTVAFVYNNASYYVTFHLVYANVAPKYQVTFYAGEGTFNADYSVTEGSNIKIVEESVINALPIPYRSGYLFKGWYENSAFAGSKIVTPYNITRTLNLYARWVNELNFEVVYLKYLDGSNYGTLSTVDDIEYGTAINLAAPATLPEYNFAGYEYYESDLVYNPATSVVLGTDAVGTQITVTKNLYIRVRYTIKQFTITYTSSVWTEPKTTVVNYGATLTEAPYGVPALVGHTGKWMWQDGVVQKAPVYENITADMTIVAVYTINEYKVTFYDKDDRLLDRSYDRSAVYGTVLASFYNVPAVRGYTGKWYIMNAQGELIEADLANLVITGDLKVYARYTVNIYRLTYVFDMRLQSNPAQTQRITKEYSYAYGTAVPSGEDLTQDMTVANVQYLGYDSYYYGVKWYNSSDKQLGNLVTFPVTIGDGNITLYAGVTAKPYTVDFIVDIPADLYGAERHYVKTLTKNPADSSNLLKTPLFPELEEYDITLWSADVDGGSVSYNLADYLNGIPVTDFHTKAFATDGSTPYDYDRAFYAGVKLKSFNVEYYTVDSITLSGENYVYNYGVSATVIVDYGTTSIVDVATAQWINDNTPEYASGSPSSFVFEGWHTDQAHKTRALTSSAGHLLIEEVKDNIKLYAKWTDELVGTEGLHFTLSEGEDYYTVSGYIPAVPDLAHVNIIIPENHNEKPVRAIGEDAFNTGAALVFIDKITLTANLNAIAPYAFASCGSLTQFEFGAANSNFVIGADGALYDASYTVLYALPAKAGEASFTLPVTVAQIAPGAFAGCEITAFSTIMGSALTTIGAYAFDGCENLASVQIPDGVTSIGQNAFRVCYALSTIEISENSLLSQVSRESFTDTSWYIQELNAGGDTIVLGRVLLAYFGTATAYTLDNDIYAIADGCFDVSDESTGYTTFALTSFTIGSGSALTRIGNRAFYACPALSTITLACPVKVEISADTFAGVAQACVLKVPAALLSVYGEDEAITLTIDEIV